MIASIAAAAGVSQPQWIAALIGRRLHGRPRVSYPEALQLVHVVRELKRIRVNLNRIAEALQSEGPASDARLEQAAEIGAFAEAVGEHMLAVRRAFEGNLDYWSADR